MEDCVTIEECQTIGFDDGEDEAWSRLDAGMETDSILAKEHDWVQGIIDVVGRNARFRSGWFRQFADVRIEWCHEERSEKPGVSKIRSGRTEVFLF